MDHKHHKNKRATNVAKIKRKTINRGQHKDHEHGENEMEGVPQKNNKNK